MDKICVLQLGTEDWTNRYTIPDYLKWFFEDYSELDAKKSFDLVIWNREPRESECDDLYQRTKAYTLFVSQSVELGEHAQSLYQSKVGQRIADEDWQQFLLTEARFYFPNPYGEKFHPEWLSVSRDFAGTVKWNGQYSVELQGDYGDTFGQIVFWRNNIPIYPNQMIDFWLEYKKTPGIEISLVLTRIKTESMADITMRKEYSESDLEQVIQLEGGTEMEWIYASVCAKGKGNLQIIALHDRYSRGTHGCFLPGGERYVTSDREEVFCYFDPMNRKPPLNVYFSGYKTQEGFEGYNMMRRLGAPYLLVAEQRLEGGSFYMGTEEYERLLTDIIYRYMEQLGFSSEQVIFSGLSMGTYGALRYGCDIQPHAIILGKPLASIGNVAANERQLRPGGFPTSLDVLRYIAGDTDEAAVKRLNERFWKKYDATDWIDTKFVISYMIEDDYDDTAYEELASHMQSEGTMLYGKGLHGRHNDNTNGIVNWFIRQYRQILKEDFGRKLETE